MSRLSRGQYGRLIGLEVYDMGARRVGVVRDLWIEAANGSTRLYLVVETANGEVGVDTSFIAAAGDIVILKDGYETIEVPAPEQRAAQPAGVDAPESHAAARPRRRPPGAGLLGGLVKRRHPQQPSTTPAQGGNEGGYVVPRCPACGSALVYDVRRRKWYCHHCGKYVTLPSSVEARVPRCPKCGTPLSYIEQYGKWYCYSCRRYVEVGG